MNKYRREVTIEILVGLFMFVVLIALGIFTIVLSHENMLKKSYAYEVIFPEVNGLHEGDNVFLRGMNVGRVKQTDLQGNHVAVYVSLDVPLHLRKGYKIEVVDASMLGGKNLKIYEGAESAPLLNEKMTILGSKPIDMIEELNASLAGMKSMIDSVNAGEGTLGKLLTDDGVYNNLAQISEDLKEVMARVKNGEGSLGKLLVSDDGQLYEDGKAMMANLRLLSQNLAAGKGSIGKLLTDDGQVYVDGKATMTNLRTLTQSLVDGKGTLGQLVSGDSSVYEDLEVMLSNVRSISESINNGEGTLGRLVRDAKLYDEATLLVEDIRAAVDDLREASPITSFGSVLFGAF